MISQNRRLGNWGEHVAVRFLEKKQYQIIQKNFTTRVGEIDIIAYREYPIHGRTLCFIEVKTRSSPLDAASRATGFRKQQHMQAAARIFCLQQRIPMDRVPIQFEHVSIYSLAKETAKIYHYVVPIS